MIIDSEVVNQNTKWSGTNYWWYRVFKNSIQR